ncbi:MAG: archease [candidate division Zixibacteria bacterium]|nr:archease [candidate division Zixibacteria bacterium]
MRKYEITDKHTCSDIGVELVADSLEELYIAGAEGLFFVICGSSTNAGTKRLKITLESDDHEQLLIDWLSELIYYFDTNGYVGTDYSLRITNTGRHLQLEADIDVREFNVENETAAHEIKAVTYYKLAIEELNGQFTCHVVFDL